MNNKKITLVVGKDEVTLFDRFLFSRDINIEKKSLYCAEFDPPMMVDNKSVSHLHFADFLFSVSSLHFKIGASEDIIVDINFDLKIKIVDPVAVPQMSSFNEDINSERDTVSVQLFHLQGGKSKISDVEFWKSFRTKWIDVAEIINKDLKDASKGHYGVSVGIVNKAGVMPSLKPIDKLFSVENSYKKGKRVIVMIVRSFKSLTFKIGDNFVSVDNLPRIPKDIIFRICSAQKNEFNTIQRRTIKVCLNGGIPVHLLDSGLNLKYRKRFFKSLNFDQVELYFGDADQISVGILDKLKIYIENAVDHLGKDSSESDLRILFWDPVLNRMFQHGLESQQKPYQIKGEWSTKTLFSEHRSQWVDYVSLINLGEQNFPILLVEIGKEPFNLNSPHKDQSKLLGMMSQTCLKLTRALIDKKRRPEIARVGGIWIGGLTIQFVVAHPVVTKMPNGLFSIQVHLSSNPHWFHDLTKTHQPSSCTTICCASSNGESFEFERIKAGTLNMSNYKIISETKIKEKSLNEPVLFSDSTSESDSDSGSAVASNLDVGSRSTSNSPTSLQVVQPQTIYSAGLKATNFFVQYLKAAGIKIINEFNSDSNDTRNFENVVIIGISDSSRRSSTNKSPEKKKVEMVSTGSPLRNYGTQGDSLEELQISLKLSAVSTLFPKIHGYEIIPASETKELVVTYEFERMEPLFDAYNQTLSPKIKFDHPLDTLYGSLVFAIQTLCSLNQLHQNFGLIHSDISINNIMYSPLYNTWKLIDFGQSLGIEESLMTPRTAGTRGFVAPESLESGIFTKESDLYSLGRVFDILLNYLILHEICLNDDSELVNEEMAGFGHRFLSIIRKMTFIDPSERPSTFDCIIDIFEILQNFPIFKNDPIYIFVKSIIESQEIEAMRQSFEESIKIATELSHAKIQEPKAPTDLTWSEAGLKRSRTFSTLEEERESIVQIPPTEESNRQ